MPEVRADYAGYIAWRGLIEERDLPGSAAAVLRNRFSLFEYPNSHMLVYLVRALTRRLRTRAATEASPPD
jgi:hypothetical protein